MSKELERIIKKVGIAYEERAYKSLVPSVRGGHKPDKGWENWEKELSLIEQALKRNEPKKVYIDYDMMAFECSNCVENGTTDSMWSFNEIGEYTYCPRCGNKLDWKKK